MKGYTQEVYVDFLDKSKDIQMMKGLKIFYFLSTVSEPEPEPRNLWKVGDGARARIGKKSEPGQ